ncbi:ribonuclease H-like domain-containing protein [Tanacetum coccineum]
MFSTAQLSTIHLYGGCKTPAMFSAPVSYAPTPPHAFHTMTLQNPNWNMDTGASSHLADNTICQFTRDNDVSVEFDAYGFFGNGLHQTGRTSSCCDSTGDLYPVTQQPSSQNPVVLLSFSSTTWHRRLGHPGDDVLRRLESGNLISCHKPKLPTLCHACQLAVLSYGLSKLHVLGFSRFASLLHERRLRIFYNQLGYYFLHSELGKDGEPVSDQTYIAPCLSDSSVSYFTHPDYPYAVQQLNVHYYSVYCVIYTDADWAWGFPCYRRSTSEELIQTQREAQQANELSNLTRQRQLLASVNYRRAIIQELKRLPGNLVACKMREHIKCIQKDVFVEVIELKKELRL